MKKSCNKIALFSVHTELGEHFQWQNFSKVNNKTMECTKMKNFKIHYVNNNIYKKKKTVWKYYIIHINKLLQWNIFCEFHLNIIRITRSKKNPQLQIYVIDVHIFAVLLHMNNFLNIVYCSGMSVVFVYDNFTCNR